MPGKLPQKKTLIILRPCPDDLRGRRRDLRIGVSSTGMVQQKGHQVFPVDLPIVAAAASVRILFFILHRLQLAILDQCPDERPSPPERIRRLINREPFPIREA